MERRFQLWWPVGEQDHLGFFRESSEASRTRERLHRCIDPIAGGGQSRGTGRANELQKSPPVHDITFVSAKFESVSGKPEASRGSRVAIEILARIDQPLCRNAQTCSRL